MSTITVCAPINTLDNLLNISVSCLTTRLKSLPLVPRYTSPRQKVLLCHDMKGGYLEDKYVQGCQTKDPCYRFFRWHLIDIFVYFSHELVTIPPVVWIDCTHKNGVQILGTFITEFDTGREICRQLLASDENIEQTVEALALLMTWYNFDGYLLNIENQIELEYIPRLLSFISKLKLACIKLNPNSLVIWYDSVTRDGELKWQNQLNDFNQSFFKACDGIFLNYTWQPEMLLNSKLNAGERCRDIFVGIDVFGRGCFGGGGFNTCAAMALPFKNDLSTALFAPGWLFETLDKNEFIENDRKFWNSLQPFTSQRILPMKSLVTFFSDGFGKKIFIPDLTTVQNAWYNLSLQSYLPNVLNENRWSLNHDDAYFGGSCIELNDVTTGYFRLFKCLIPIKSVCEITLVFKDVADIALEFMFDNGTHISLENSEKDEVIREWKRKTYRFVVNEQVSVTDVSVRYSINMNSVLKLGYFSIIPIEELRPMKIATSPSMIRSVEQTSDSSIIVNFAAMIEESDSSMIFVFVCDQYEQYLFLGATRQSYFVIYQSDIVNNKQEYSTLLFRNYSLDTLDLLNEEILKIPITFDSVEGFSSTNLSFESSLQKNTYSSQLDSQQ